MRRALAHLLFIGCLMGFGNAFAAEAKVVWVDPSCSYFIATVESEFGIYQWRSGSAPSEGDVFAGPLLDKGMLEATNTTRNGVNSIILVALSPRLVSLVNSSPVQCKRRYEKQS
jgi:hypothetical protein